MSAVARPALFREAAVAAHAAAAGPGRAVPSSRRLLRRASAVLVAAVVVGVVGAATVRVDETAAGRWSADPGSIRSGVARLPIGALGRLSPGQRVRITTVHGFVGGHVTTVPSPIEADDGAVTEVHVALDGPAPAAGVADAPVTVRLGRRSLLSLVRAVFDRRSGRG
jgi:hypothetical protein